MDVNGIRKDFQAPLSPAAEEFYAEKAYSSSSGEHLFRQFASFYAWYMAWDPFPSEHAQTFQLLSQIKRIALVSKEGGEFLSNGEEERAIESLHTLKTGLYDGNIHQSQIPDYLSRIISDLTQENHKARLVAHTTELEYILCIHPPVAQSSEVTEIFRGLLNQIITQVVPTLLDRDAHAIDQGIVQIINNVHSIEDVHQAIHKAIKGWL